VLTADSVRDLVANVDDDSHRVVVPGEGSSLGEPGREGLHVSSAAHLESADVSLNLPNVVSERFHERWFSPVTLLVPKVSVANDSEANFLELRFC